MKKLFFSLLLPALASTLPVTRAFGDPNNPNINMKEHLRISDEAAAHRATRRVSEDKFIRLSREPGTVVLDARSKAKFDLLHVQGAINLSFPDIDVESLQKTLPDKNTRILIYCNNNFEGDQTAFPAKAISASLNISTYITLYTYGYKNVYELAPMVNVKTTKLKLTGSR